MPSRDDITEETQTFRAPSDWARTAAGDVVHLLLLLPENAPPERLALPSLPIIIGRTSPADIILEGGTVSRRHCRLELHGDQVVLTDLGSTNGTYIGETRVEGPVILEDGAAISIGAHRLRYHRRARDETEDAEAMDQELKEASQYVTSILPAPIQSGPVEARWHYQPCTRLGGDSFGYQMLDSRHFSMFLLDVAGHGTGAALHAVSVANVLRQQMMPSVDFLEPASVLRALNRAFPMAGHNELFFTIWYGVYDIVTRVLTYASAGHHAAYLSAGPGTIALATKNPSIGIMPDRDVTESRVAVPPDSTLSLFSDGVFEIVDRDGRQWSIGDLSRLLPLAADENGPRRLYQQVRAVARPGPMEDDFSFLSFRFP